MPDVLADLYNMFDPFEPLPAGDDRYVECQSVRGDEDIRIDLGNKILRSRPTTCQLYSGHRGGGKSTELRRLTEHLEKQGFFVVYFEADEEDVEPEDTQYSDILLACTRRILEKLKGQADPSPLTTWLKARWDELKELALSEVEFDKLELSVQISQFAKLSANVRSVPSLRHQIRQKIDPYTVTLIEALNEFIDNAKKNLPNGAQKLAVIADNLDRIVLIPNEATKRTNHEEIFLDRSEQLRKLDCHLVYTVPISLVYSDRAADLRELYGQVHVLPMVMLQDQNENIHPPGMKVLREAIAKRVRKVAPNLDLETQVFENAKALEGLCLMSGGHVRNLMLLTQEAIANTMILPIRTRAVRRAITSARDTYRRTVEDNQWQLLARVSHKKSLINEDECRSLMLNRCLLEYVYYDEEGEKQRWYDVHPLIRGIAEFKEALGSQK